MTKDTLSVLLVDDHEVVRAGYHRLLESHPGISVVAQATTGAEACQLYQQQHLVLTNQR